MDEWIRKQKLANVIIHTKASTFSPGRKLKQWKLKRLWWKSKSGTSDQTRHVLGPNSQVERIVIILIMVKIFKPGWKTENLDFC